MTRQLRNVACIGLWDHRVLPARLLPGRYSIYLPRRDVRLSWPSWLDSAPAGSRASDLSITSPTPNHCTSKKTNINSAKCTHVLINMSAQDWTEENDLTPSCSRMQVWPACVTHCSCFSALSVNCCFTRAISPRKLLSARRLDTNIAARSIMEPNCRRGSASRTAAPLSQEQQRRKERTMTRRKYNTEQGTQGWTHG